MFLWGLLVLLWRGSVAKPEIQPTHTCRFHLRGTEQSRPPSESRDPTSEAGRRVAKPRAKDRDCAGLGIPLFVDQSHDPHRDLGLVAGNPRLRSPARRGLARQCTCHLCADSTNLVPRPGKDLRRASVDWSRGRAFHSLSQCVLPFFRGRPLAPGT